MADNKYCVVRTDLMNGTKQVTDLVSVRFYNSEDKAADVENGVIVKLSGLDEGEREIYKATAASSTDDLNDCAIVASVETMYDERKHNLDEYVNTAGKAARGYIPRSRNIFSVTKEGFVGGATPTKGADVGIGTGGKIDASGTGLGKCIAIENAGRYTFYVIQIGKTEG